MKSSAKNIIIIIGLLLISFQGYSASPYNKKIWLTGGTFASGIKYSSADHGIITGGSLSPGYAINFGFFTRETSERSNWFMKYGASYEYSSFSTTTGSNIDLGDQLPSVVTINPGDNINVINKAIKLHVSYNYYIMRRYYNNVYASIGYTPEIPIPGLIKHNDTEYKFSYNNVENNILHNFASFNLSLGFEIVTETDLHITIAPEYNFSMSSYSENDTRHFLGVRLSVSGVMNKDCNCPTF